MADLFSGPPASREGEMPRAREKALAELRSRMEELEARADAEPDDTEKARKAARAREAYEGLRAHHEKQDDSDPGGTQ